MANEFNYARESCAAAQRAIARTLNDRPIRDWVAEGHADFDDVRARLRSSKDDVGAGFERGISSGDVGYKPEFAGVRKGAKFPFDSSRMFFGGRLSRDSGAWFVRARKL
jgi:hypothetical protein